MDLKDLEKLTDEQLRAKCAELAGWYRSDDAIPPLKAWRHPDIEHHTTCLPNYLYDLNACAEFEKDAPNDYWNNLAIVTGCDRNPFYEAAPPSAWADFASASAKLRTIAFILTKSNQ